jgi:purine nucleosidase
MMKNIIFDTDLLGDDLLTLAALCVDPNVRLVAVTSYGRCADGSKRAEIADRFVNSMGVHSIDIIAGADCPMIQPALEGCLFCNEVIDAFCGRSNIVEKPDNTTLKKIHAAEYLANKICESPGTYSLLCTGPLTNIAMAFLLNPDLPQSIKEIVIMGGAWKIGGNVSSVAEANIYNDPEAAKIVFDHFKHITLVPLDVTTQVCINSDCIEEDNQKILVKFFRDIIASCCKAQIYFGNKAEMPLHDLLAFYVLVEPSLVKTEICSIHIETRSILTRGFTYCNFSDRSMDHHVALDVDVSRVLIRYQSFIKKLAYM